MAHGLLLSDDLIFISRISGTARDLGLTLPSVRSPDALLTATSRKEIACVLLDLNHPGLDLEAVPAALKAAGCYLVGYGSHVDSATLKRAREAGVDVVLPRSKFVEVLPVELGRWFAKGHSPSPEQPVQ